MVASFIGRVDVAPVRGSHLVDVTFVSEDPKFAADAANALIDEYVSENLEIKLRSTQGMLEWLEAELASQQKRVEQSERALARVPRKGKCALARRQTEYRALAPQPVERRGDARAEQPGPEGVAVQPGQGGRQRTNPDAIPIIATNAAVQTARSKLSDLQRQKVQLLERYAENIPKYWTSTRSCRMRSGSSTSRSPPLSNRSGTSTKPRSSRSRRSRKTSTAPRAKRPTSIERGSATA